MYGILVGAPESWKEMRGLGTEGGEKGQRWRIHLAPPLRLLEDDAPGQGPLFRV